jgi:hypothetical protein
LYELPHALVFRAGADAAGKGEVSSSRDVRRSPHDRSEHSALSTDDIVVTCGHRAYKLSLADGLTPRL